MEAYDAPDGKVRHAELTCHGATAQPLCKERTKSVEVGDDRWPSDALALCPCSTEFGVGALDDPRPLDFGQDANEGEHRSPDGRCEIERLPE